LFFLLLVALVEREEAIELDVPEDERINITSNYIWRKASWIWSWFWLHKYPYFTTNSRPCCRALSSGRSDG
jgi:hypothetical protein